MLPSDTPTGLSFLVGLVLMSAVIFALVEMRNPSKESRETPGFFDLPVALLTALAAAGIVFLQDLHSQMNSILGVIVWIVVMGASLPVMYILDKVRARRGDKAASPPE